MVSLFKKLWHNKRGNALVIAGAALPLVVGAAGLASDTIQWTLWKRQLQRAADSAAIAGVYTRMRTNTQAAVEASVAKDNDKNLHTWMGLRSGFPDVDLLANDEPIADAEHAVKVALEIQQKLPFSSMFLSSAPIIRAVATAATVPIGANYCVKALDPSAKVVGIEITGSTYLDLGECSLIANSTNPTNAASNGNNGSGEGKNSTVIAKSLAAGGGVDYSNSWDVDHYNPYSSPVDDDYKDLASNIPSNTSECTRNITLSGGTEDRSAVDQAGDVVCISNVDGKGDPAGLTISGKVKLGSATYILNGGDLTMNSTGSELKCSSCTIVMTDLNDRTKTGNVKLTGGTVDISAPKGESETWKDIAFYQDPLAKDNGKTGQNQINGNSSGGVQGVVYFGNQSLLWNGGGNATAMCLQLVAKRLAFSGSSKIQVKSACGYGDSDDVMRRVRLVA
jgi:hypothetical protein